MINSNVAKKQLLVYCIDLLFFSGVIAIALKFGVFWNKWVYFPLFPNIFDSTLLVFSVVWFVLRIYKRV
jgi:hypothetical protein